MTTRTKLTPEDIDRLFVLQKEIKKLTAEADKIKEAIKEAWQPGDYEVVAGSRVLNVSLIEARGALNKKLFRRDFPEKEFPTLYALEPDSEAIREVLRDDAEDYFGKVIRLTVTLGEADDE